MKKKKYIYFGVCPICNKKKRLKTKRWCAACWAKVYRGKPKVHKKHIEAVRAYERKNPEKRRIWQRNYKLSVGVIVHPQVHELRKAQARLEKAVGFASKRQGFRIPSKRSRNTGPKQ